MGTLRDIATVVAVVVTIAAHNPDALPELARELPGSPPLAITGSAGDMLAEWHDAGEEWQDRRKEQDETSETLEHDAMATSHGATSRLDKWTQEQE